MMLETYALVKAALGVDRSPSTTPYWSPILPFSPILTIPRFSRLAFSAIVRFFSFSLSHSLFYRHHYIPAGAVVTRRNLRNFLLSKI